MNAPLRIGIAGLGTVGAEVARLLQTEGELLAQRGGRPLRLAGVSARRRDKARAITLDGLPWFEDPRDLARAQDLDVMVELIGGADGVAREVVETALAHGKHVVTANKALLAHHGAALARMADAAGLALNYEAAVAGGIPIVKAMREGLAANRISRVFGILNGTCNYVLSAMETSGRPFAEVLAEAQSLGYAEADPATDIGGLDTAHKLTILTSLAFGAAVDLAGVHVEGIARVSAADIAFARELGYRIKLLGIASRSEAGIAQRVHPCLVPLDSPIADVNGVLNGVVVEGECVGQVMFEGRGAGGGPTASAVLADLIDLARGRRLDVFTVPGAALAPAASVPMAAHVGAYYVRLSVLDQPGVMAALATAFARQEVSIDSLIQRGRAPGEAVAVVLVTHETEETAMCRALREIESFKPVLEPPCMIRIEKL